MARLIASSGFLLLLVAIAAPAADLTGIWSGQMQGRRGVEDVAFEFKQKGANLTGKVFGDEFDIAIEEGSVSEDQVKFTITSTNYYSGSKIKFVYTGVVKGSEIELTRERLPSPTDEETPNRPPSKQTFKVKRLTS
jgi:hypothetical protein